MRAGRKLLTGFAVRCASLRSGAADWRSGPRWSILSVLCPVHPFASSRHFPSRGNEKIGGTGYCVTYDTDSQSRNAPCVPFRGRGPRSGEGVDGGKNDYEIFLFYVLSPPKGETTHYILRVAGDTTLLHNPRRQPPPFFKICARRAPPQPSA